MDGRDIGLHNVLFPHQIGDVGADAEARRVGIRQQDETVFPSQRLEQLLAFFILVDGKAVRQQDHRIRQVRKPRCIVFSFHDQHTAGVDKIFLVHRPLPASARRQRAASSSTSSSTGWLFKHLSRSSSTCRQASSWASV